MMNFNFRAGPLLFSAGTNAKNAGRRYKEFMADLTEGATII